MEINNIEEAKKFINKCIYTAYDFDVSNKYKVVKLYIGGVNLFYNQVNYTVEGFVLYEDSKETKCWGDIKLNDIGTFNESNQNNPSYSFSKEDAEKYCRWVQKDNDERQKEYNVKVAIETLKKYKIKFEIFE